VEGAVVVAFPDVRPAVAVEAVEPIEAATDDPGGAPRIAAGAALDKDLLGALAETLRRKTFK
jgi:hypothetical protein